VLNEIILKDILENEENISNVFKIDIGIINLNEIICDCLSIAAIDPNLFSGLVNAFLFFIIKFISFLFSVKYGDKKINVDHIFKEVSNVEVYEKIEPLVRHWLQKGGKFGQTGSGKSHTCGTQYAEVAEADMGIWDRILQQVCDQNLEYRLNLKFEIKIDEIHRNASINLMQRFSFDCKSLKIVKH